MQPPDTPGRLFVVSPEGVCAVFDRPGWVRLSSRARYSPARGVVEIDGVEFSPGVLAAFTDPDREWRGPFWIRRSPGGETAEIATINPLLNLRDH